MNRHYSISTFFMYVIFTSAHASAAGCKLRHFRVHRDSDHGRVTVSRLFVRSLIICEQDCSKIVYGFRQNFPCWFLVTSRRMEKNLGAIRIIFQIIGSPRRSCSVLRGGGMRSTEYLVKRTTTDNASVQSSHRVKERWIHGGRWWKMVQKLQDEDAERDDRGRAVPSSLAAAARGVQRKYCCAVATWASARVIDDIVA